MSIAGRQNKAFYEQNLTKPSRDWLPARSRWRDVALVLSLRVMDLAFGSIHKHAKKELGQYPALTEQAWPITIFIVSYQHTNLAREGILLNKNLLLKWKKFVKLSNLCNF